MRILVAEDDTGLLKSLVHIFQTNHYSVDGVSNGADAYAYAASNEYDGLVLDIMMPAMDGLTVLKKLSRLFGVSVDSLLDDSPEKKAAQHTASEPGSVSRRAIVRVSVVGIWTLATLLFVIFWVFLESIHWLIFVFAVPVTLIVLLVFNSIWHNGKGNFWIVSGLVLSVIVLMYLTLLSRNNPWQLFLVAAPAELLVYCSFRIKKRKK